MELAAWPGVLVYFADHYDESDADAPATPALRTPDRTELERDLAVHLVRVLDTLGGRETPA